MLVYSNRYLTIDSDQIKVGDNQYPIQFIGKIQPYRHNTSMYYLKFGLLSGLCLIIGLSLSYIAFIGVLIFGYLAFIKYRQYDAQLDEATLFIVIAENTTIIAKESIPCESYKQALEIKEILYNTMNVHANS